MDKPTAAPASGAKQQIEKQARQLAYDTRYKVKQSMASKSGARLDPAAVRKAYMSQLGKSSAAPAVKARAKQMLLGEDLIDTRELVNQSVVSALHKVFVEGIEEENTQENEYLDQLNEMDEKKYKVRVTDKKTKNTYVRMATRAKIAELRRNPNIASVEMTSYGEVSKSEASKGESTAKAKAGKGLDPVGKEDGDVNNDGKKDKTDDYLIKRRKAIGSAIATRKEEVIYEKEDGDEAKKITGKNVNNYKKSIKIFPEVSEEMKPGEDLNPVQQKPQKKQDTSSISQVLLAKQRVDAAQKDLANKQRMAAQKKVDLQSLSASYEPEGDQLSEREDSPYEKASDAALNSRYGYGRASGDKRSFGRAANRSSAAAALRAIRRGERSGSGTSREAGADAVHQGWAKTAKTSTDQTPEKQEKRAQLANTPYSKLSDDEKEKDRVSFDAVKAVHKARKSNLSASYEPEGDDIQEVAPPGMEKTVKKMKKHPELSRGTTPEGKKKSPYALAWYMYNKKKGIEEGCECEDEKEPKLKKSEGGVEDSREIPTKTNLVKNKLRAMGLKMDYEPEGEVIDERRRVDKGKPRGPEPSAAFKLVSKSMGAGRMGVQPRGQKKVPGKKPPAAGEYGAPRSPAQKVAMRRAAAQRSQDMYRPRAGESD